MSETLYLQLPHAGDTFHWLAVDAIGNRIGRVQEGPLGDALPQASGRRLVVLAPGEDVAVHHADIPSRNPQKVLQAAPYMLEDKLAEDVDNLHFAAGPHEDAGHLIAVVSHDRMRAWVDTLAQRGLAAAQLTPDMLALPTPGPGGCIAVLDAGRVLARLADGSGFSADLELAGHLLARRLAKTDASVPAPRLQLYAADGPDADALTAALQQAGVEVARAPLTDGALPLLASQLRGRRAPDLLQGEFQTHGGFEEHWRTWRVAAFLLAACLVLGITQQVTDYVRLHRQAAALDTQVSSILSQLLPGSSISPGTEKVRVQQLLAQLQGGDSGGSLLGLLDALGGALNGMQGVQVTALDYQNSSLQVQLQAGDIGALDALKATLSQQNGISVTLDSVNASGSQVTGRLVLSGSAT